MASCSLWQGAIVRRCGSYAPYSFGLDAIRKLSPSSSRRCHEHASRVYEGKAEHGDDGFAVERSIGSDRHDRPGVRVARLACARKWHPSVSFRGRKTGETCQKSGGFHQRRVLRRALPSVRTWRPRATASIRPGQRHHSFWAAPLLPALSSRVDENHPISGRTPSPKLHVSRKEACIGALGLRRGLFLARSSKNGACICIVLSSWEDSDSLVGAYNDASCRSRPRRTLQNNSC